MDQRGSLVADHRLPALVSIPAAQTLAPQCHRRRGTPCSETLKSALFTPHFSREPEAQDDQCPDVAFALRGAREEMRPELRFFPFQPPACPATRSLICTRFLQQILKSGLAGWGQKARAAGDTS